MSWNPFGRSKKAEIKPKSNNDKSKFSWMFDTSDVGFWLLLAAVLLAGLLAGLQAGRWLGWSKVNLG